MYTDGTPGSPYLAKWSCTVQAAPAFRSPTRAAGSVSD